MQLYASAICMYCFFSLVIRCRTSFLIALGDGFPALHPGSDTPRDRDEQKLYSGAATWQDT
jgi:hypothetical protein